jgi:hypothetical protein
MRVEKSVRVLLSARHDILMVGLDFPLNVKWFSVSAHSSTDTFAITIRFRCERGIRELGMDRAATPAAITGRA